LLTQKLNRVVSGTFPTIQTFQVSDHRDGRTHATDSSLPCKSLLIN
jgi:hypothetical protein